MQSKINFPAKKIKIIVIVKTISVSQTGKKENKENNTITIKQKEHITNKKNIAIMNQKKNINNNMKIKRKMKNVF